MIDPTNSDIGRGVIYVPRHACGDQGHKNCERGVITSFNICTVWARYGSGETSAGSLREDLFWEHERGN